jgi:phosphohistidine phosphatase SixA
MKRFLFASGLLVATAASAQTNCTQTELFETCKAKPGRVMIEDKDKIDAPQHIKLDPNLSLKTMSKGGYVFLIRHTSRENLEGDALWNADRKGECIKGSELNEKGIAEAKQIRAALAEAKVQIGEMVSTPACRNVQMGKVIHDKVDVVTLDVTYWPMLKPWEWHNANRGLIKYLSTPVKAAGKNRAIMSHNNVLEGLRIKGLPSQTLAFGDVAVVRPLGNGKFVYLGNIKFTDYAK